MSEKPKASGRDDASTRQLLLTAAAKVFAERGYEGATVKDLADTAGVNVSLVSYYFGGKEGLYRKCLEEFGRDRLSTAERVLKKPETVEEFRLRLQMFAEEFLRANVRDMFVCKILHRDMDTGTNPVAMDVFKTTFLPVFSTVLEFFTAAQNANILRDDVEPRLAASLLIGSLVHIVRSDEVRKMVFNESLADEKVLERTVQDYTRIYLDGALRRSTP